MSQKMNQRGGQELSSYADHGRLSSERRTIAGEKRDAIETEIQHIFDRIAAADPAFRATEQ